MEFLNLARIKKLLDGWYDEHYEHQALIKRHATPQIEHRHYEPPVDEKQRVSEGFKKLSLQLQSGVGPSTYADPEISTEGQ